MSKSGGGTPSQTTTTTEPPAFIQPYMQDAAAQSRSLYNQGPSQYYPGQTVVPFSGQTEQAMGMTENRAINGSPVNQAAQGFAARTLNQDPTSQFGGASNPYASNTWQEGGNPYLDQTFNRAADSVQNRLSSQFAGSGRNIDASRPAQAQEMNDLAAGIYGGAYDSDQNRQMAAYSQANSIGAQGYENERSRMASDLNSMRSQQLGAAGLAPTLANQDYVDAQALQGVGTQMEDLTGNYMQDAAARWDYGQQAPGQALDAYIGRITGSYPGQSTSQITPTYRNRGAGAAGGALSGAATGSTFGPWGAAIGAVGGGLLGYYGS